MTIKFTVTLTQWHTLVDKNTKQNSRTLQEIGQFKVGVNDGEYKQTNALSAARNFMAKNKWLDNHAKSHPSAVDSNYFTLSLTSNNKKFVNGYKGEDIMQKPFIGEHNSSVEVIPINENNAPVTTPYVDGNSLKNLLAPLALVS